MHFTVEPDYLAHLQSQIPTMTPWMHFFKFNEDVFTGYLKRFGISETYCLREKAPQQFENIEKLFSDYIAGQPFHDMDVALKHFSEQDRGQLSALDIASATGKYSFYLASQGVGTVHGVEIRSEQVQQAELIRQGLSDEMQARLTFTHDPMSADDPAFREGEQYDLVLSMGLLYHLPNPLQHFYNLARMTRKVLVLHTLIHRIHPRYWQLVAEDPNWITKSVQGVSWIGHYAEVARWLKEAGFKSVQSVVPPPHQNIASAYNLTPPSTPQRYLNHYLQKIGMKPSLENYIKPEQYRHGHHSPFYFTYIAVKD